MSIKLSKRIYLAVAFLTLVAVFVVLAWSSTSWSDRQEKKITPRGGGILRLRDDEGKTAAMVRIPPKALSETTVISAEVELSPSEERIYFTFGPEGTQFARPVTIYLSKRMLVRNGIGCNDLKLFYFDKENGGKWREIAKAQNHQMTVRAEVNHFSRYYFGRR